MGGNQSMTMDTATKILNQNILDVMKKTTIDSKTIGSVSDSFMVEFGKGSSIIGCDININSKLNFSQTTYAMVQMDNSQNIQNLMTQAFNQALSENQKAVNDFLSTTFQNQDTSIKTTNDLENIFQQNLSTANLTNLTNVSQTLKAGHFEFNGLVKCVNGQSINITEDTVVNQYVNNASSEMFSILSQNEEAAKLIEALKASQASQNKGVGDLMKTLGLFVLLPLAVVGIFFFLNSQGKNLKESKNNIPKALTPATTAAKFHFY
jgi:hypothetical protein